ncbi:MAG: carbohydrate-binding family 9-like protein [Proteobacteria bacterium]|nr:carbohydrate-binding family 9-like protein [Pseudomonadota bacterium]
MKQKPFDGVCVFLLTFLTFAAASCAVEQPAKAQGNIVFACDFTNSFSPQICVQACDVMNRGACIVDAPNGKAVRTGKRGEEKNLLIYQVKKNGGPLPNDEVGKIFPVRAGRLEFSFKPVDWEIGDPNVRVLMIIADSPLSSDHQSVLSVRYIRVQTTPAIQVEYGQRGQENVEKGKRPVIFMDVPLEKQGKDHWYKVVFEWDPSELNLNVDGKTTSHATGDLSIPERFAASVLTIGFIHDKLTSGLTDVTGVKIYAKPVIKQKYETKNAGEKPERFPSVVIGAIAAPPKLDGEKSEGEWDEAVSITGFKELPGSKFSSHQPKLKIAAGEENLYFYFETPLYGKKLKADLGQGDGLWNDDSIEIFLAPIPGTKDFFQIIINSKGFVFDQHDVPGKALSENQQWNCEGLKIGSKTEKDTWTVEVAIPYSALGETKPQRGKKWLFNFCESRHGVGIFSLAGVRHGYGEKENFGELVFDDALPLINVRSFGPLRQGKAEFIISALNAGNKKVKLNM